ncbi:MAG TPA: flagellar hook-length control protein FliK [Rhodocyclaceae bacterium]|nr:flagellar hook-length control protein FliK [Rhodocyclaceae bacterium]
MPEVSKVSPLLPVAAAAPTQGGINNNAVSQGNGQSPFSQVLRDKQIAADKASAKADAPKSAQKPASKAEKTDSKTESVQKDEITEGDTVTTTPAYLAQLLAAAGLTANNQADASAAADATTTDATDKQAAEPGIAALLPKDDKAAVPAANLAAGTATSTSAEQALALQGSAATLDNKGTPANGSGNDQQANDEQSLLALAGQGNGKAHAASADQESSFAAALDRASQTGDVRTGMQMNNAAQPQATQAPSTHTVATPIGRQGWADEVGQRVLWTAKSDSNRADLILTPPQLGRIEVSIHMNGDQANASFMVANPVAREALQDAMPKLRELMAQAGIQLGQADVSAGQSGQSQNNSHGERRQSGGTGMGGNMQGISSMTGTTSGQWTRQGAGLVDTFA